MTSLKKNFRPGFWFLKALVRGYQLGIAPTYLFLFGAQSGCRFEESCSHYFVRQVDEAGFRRGGWLGLKRILSCHPF